MNRFINRTDWVPKLFANLCYSQVKEQLPENLIYQHSNPPGFICNGQLFVYTHNHSVIIDEPFAASGHLCN